MLRAVILVVAFLLAAGPVRAASDLDVCRDSLQDAGLRLAACAKVLSDDTITTKTRALALSGRGNVLIKKYDYDGAIAAFTAAYAADPLVDYINSRGLAYSDKGDDEHALADYELCIKLRPTYASPFNNRGLIYMRTGELDRALEDFNSAIRLPVNNASLYIYLFNRARLRSARKQYGAALYDFADAEKLQQDRRDVEYYRCVTYTDMGKLDDALTDCNAALVKFPKSSFAITSRGNVLQAKGDLDAALNDYNQALKINPNDARAKSYRGQLFEKRNDLDAARADYRSASASLRKSGDINTTIARSIAKDRLAVLEPPPVASTPPTPAPGGASAPRTPPGPRKVALIVGNGAYKNVEKLDNPPRDAKLIADTLRGLGFATVTLASDLTRDKFFAALRAFGAEAEKADWAVVYYAGHGMEIGGVNYLLPIDAKLAVDSDAEKQAVALEQLIAAVSGARKLRLVILDACRNNPFEDSMKRTIALKLVSKGFSNIEPEAGFMVVYAAKHGEVALDGDSVNSPFATVLAREIKQPKVEVRKLFDIVRDDVWADTNHAQQPFTYGSPPGRDDFYFVAAK